MAPREPVFIALGGNTGGPEAVLERFAAALTALPTQLPVTDVRISSVYLSKPVGPIAEQPDFLNAAARFMLPGQVPAPELLRELLAIEAELGRIRDSGDYQPQGPRPIDIDLLFYGDRRVNQPGPPPVTIPHPHIAQRAFVLQPLADLQGPDWIMPVIRRTVGECLARPELAPQRASLARIPQ
jgi:2-amino-4-hydroxy-6-hydroxymethyldihydropteridine diphosphokinase